MLLGIFSSSPFLTHVNEVRLKQHILNSLFHTTVAINYKGFKTYLIIFSYNLLENLLNDRLIDNGLEKVYADNALTLFC